MMLGYLLKNLLRKTNNFPLSLRGAKRRGNHILCGPQEFELKTKNRKL
jgi:hypothetical protein